MATPEADAGQLGLGTVLTDEPGLTSRVEGSTPVAEGAASTSTAG